MIPSGSKPRGILIAGNWKMNHGPAETEKFFSALQAQGLKNSDHVRVLLIPPYLSLPSALRCASNFPIPIGIGAQNAHWEKSGAFTGEISGPLLQETGVHWVLTGHSERRQYFGETDAIVHRKVESLLNQGFSIILCVGETRQERETGKTNEVLSRQINQALEKIPSRPEKLVIAYEPVWAIGTGLTATPEQAEEAHHQIRNLLLQLQGQEAADRTLILYGGSVTPENIDRILACPNVDGALVGGASLKPESFAALIQAGNRTF